MKPVADRCESKQSVCLLLVNKVHEPAKCSIRDGKRKYKFKSIKCQRIICAKIYVNVAEGYLFYYVSYQRV